MNPSSLVVAVFSVWLFFFSTAQTSQPKDGEESLNLVATRLARWPRRPSPPACWNLPRSFAGCRWLSAAGSPTCVCHSQPRRFSLRYTFRDRAALLIHLALWVCVSLFDLKLVENQWLTKELTVGLSRQKWNLSAIFDWLSLVIFAITNVFSSVKRHGCWQEKDI